MSGQIEYIPMEECQHGFLYRINSRNLGLGIYNKANNGFVGVRQKFGRLYLFTEYHYDTGPPYGTVFPIESLCPTHWKDGEIKETDNDIFAYMLMESLLRERGETHTYRRNLFNLHKRLKKAAESQDWNEVRSVLVELQNLL